jgi:ABC-type Mn2+/Zn2+ transport system ATPase subunit
MARELLSNRSAPPFPSALSEGGLRGVFADSGRSIATTTRTEQNGRSMPNNTIVEFHEVTLGYGRNVVLDSISFEIRRGDFLGIIGPNGAGKTTLLKAVLGLILPLAGHIYRAENLRYGYVMQRQNLDTLFPFTAGDIVRMGRLGHQRAWKRTNHEDSKLIDEALVVAGIMDVKDQLYRELSGGQRQRALIARALAAQPDVLLLDEPTNDMDAKGENQIMGLIRDIQKNMDVTIVLVSHLLHVVLNYVEKLMLLTDGRVHVHPIEEFLATDLLSTIYGFPLKVGQDRGKRYLLVGE